MEDWAVELRQGRPEVAWDRFVSRYRRLIFAAIRHYAQDHDDVMDVFARVCEALRENEQGAALTRNGRQLFFFSDRAGGFGGSDVYVSQRPSRRDAFGWQAPVNLGNGVNTAFNDNLPHHFLDRESGTVTLYFNSNRPAGIPGGGQTDITIVTEDRFAAKLQRPDRGSPRRGVECRGQERPNAAVSARSNDLISPTSRRLQHAT